MKSINLNKSSVEKQPIEQERQPRAADADVEIKIDFSKRRPRPGNKTALAA